MRGAVAFLLLLPTLAWAEPLGGPDPRTTPPAAPNAAETQRPLLDTEVHALQLTQERYRTQQEIQRRAQSEFDKAKIEYEQATEKAAMLQKQFNELSAQAASRAGIKDGWQLDLDGKMWRKR